MKTKLSLLTIIITLLLGIMACRIGDPGITPDSATATFAAGQFNAQLTAMKEEHNQ